MECQFCKSSFTTKTSLNSHQRTAKYCLKIQGKEQSENFKCVGCHKIFSRNYEYKRHISICETTDVVNEYKLYIRELENKIVSLEAELNIYKNLSADSQQCIKEIAKQPHYIEPTIDIFEEDETDNEENEEYKLLPLNVGENYTIENREEDNYINVTNMCKAGDKKFNDWKRIDRTKDFLKVLSMQTGIPASTLISIEQTSSTDKATWVHPQVAINIAQWISPLGYMK